MRRFLTNLAVTQRLAGAEHDGFLPAIVMPTYNNHNTLDDIVARAEALNLPIIIVNDGSTDGTTAWLAERESRDASRRIRVVSHARNRGKAAALRSGFAAASQLGCTHAVTIDTDGQLDPEDIPKMLDRARSNPRALVLGARDDRRSDYPSRSGIGRRFSNRAIWLECGARVDDSQCGLRVYPLEMLQQVRCDTERYGFEAAIITLATWRGFAVANVPVNCRYFAGERRVSHFRPWRDSVHGVFLHVRLLLLRLLPGSYPKVNRRANGTSLCSPTSGRQTLTEPS